MTAGEGHAGSYVVRACDTPAGHVQNRSWMPTVDHGFAAVGACLQRGAGLSAAVLPGQGWLTAGRSGALTFTAPEGASIADFRIDRAIYNYNPTTSAETHPPYILFQLGTTAFAGAGAYDAAVRNRVHATPPSHWYGYPEAPVQVDRGWVGLGDFPALAGYDRRAGTLRVAVGCAPSAPKCSLADPGSVAAYIHGAEVRVQDDRPPVIHSVAVLTTGAVVSATDNVGIAAVRILDASDPAAPVVLAEEDYRSGSTDPGGRCDFALSQPCPQAETETIGLGLEAGRGGIAVSVVDAAGNEVMSQPSRVVLTRERRPNGAGASPYARARVWLLGRRGKRVARTVGFAKRSRIAGRLTDGAGRSIVGAQLDVLTRSTRFDASWRPAGTVRTDDRGRFRARLPAGPSRTVRVGYRAFTTDPEYSATADAKVRVRAGIRFDASPKHVRNGSWITFRGRLVGKPGRRGVTVVIYAVGRRVQGQRARVPVEAVRTTAGGRFRYRYQFRQIAGPFHYRFQARMRPDRGYPYEPGRSRIVHVAARP